LVAAFDQSKTEMFLLQYSAMRCIHWCPLPSQAPVLPKNPLLVAWSY
jgi:hypothetical protein